MTKGSIKVTTLVIVVLAFALVGAMWMLLSEPAQIPQSEEKEFDFDGSTQTSPSTPSTGEITVVTKKAKDTDTHTGNLNIKLKSAVDGTGVTSYGLLLDKSEAILNNDGTLNKQETKYRLMDTLNLYSNGGLKGYDGSSPQDVSPSTGTWTWSVNGKVGDEFLLFTYVDKTPAKAENASTVELLKLDTWQTGDSTWSASIIGKSGSAWNLYNYPYYDWMDNANNPKLGYDYGNGGTAGTVQTITWYGNASVQGEKLIDAALLLNAPQNFTGKFQKLTVSDKNGKSVVFNRLKLASGVPGIDVTSGDVTSPTLNYNTYVFCTSGDICSLPDDLDTLRTSNDRRRLTFSMDTTTYSTQMNVTVYGLINAHAKTTTESFLFVNPFEIGLSTGSTIAYW